MKQGPAGGLSPTFSPAFPFNLQAHVVDGAVVVFFLQGSDPRVATCRGKLQNKRSRLNQEINKELRLRAGAENLFK